MTARVLPIRPPPPPPERDVCQCGHGMEFHAVMGVGFCMQATTANTYCHCLRYQARKPESG